MRNLDEPPVEIGEGLPIAALEAAGTGQLSLIGNTVELETESAATESER
jgi:hypothetical protein